MSESAPVSTTETHNLPHVGPSSVRMTCFGCSREILTNIEKSWSSTAYCCTIWSICCCGIFAICIIPACMDSESWWTTKHTCPHCKVHLGTHHP
ncbi:Lipopolysaccharide-induced tumor necrosis factor-alpha factor [Orchesella cincta]|uniref:Lipopolysaccharide-induced tumor necrosis factor-alpha factor n=1 Tax=Orchesella cincta TaxID=48709 RepID=A0A1D2MBV0_ORCCI|nr:Lipopolysaccharide-induced tumor necrosis factor-alpha factor [Orchesella cincta]